jgi:hypothetical protein
MGASAGMRLAIARAGGRRPLGGCEVRCRERAAGACSKDGTPTCSPRRELQVPVSRGTCRARLGLEVPDVLVGSVFRVIGVRNAASRMDP